MQLQDDYFAAYRSLKLTRGANGVLVIESHNNGGPFIFKAEDHTQLVDAFYRIAIGSSVSLPSVLALARSCLAFKSPC
jgi:hypothetical protein